MADTSSYHGPAREFSEGHEDFDLMLTRAVDFLDYLALWSGHGGLGEDARAKFTQQDRLGFARAMAIACEKNPKKESEG